MSTIPSNIANNATTVVQNPVQNTVTQGVAQNITPTAVTSSATSIASPVTPLNASINSLKNNIVSFLILKITFSIFKIPNVDPNIFHSLNSGGNFLENLKTYLKGNLNTFNYGLLKAILPILNFTLKHVGTNFFSRLEKFSIQNIQELSQNQSKREALLNYLATKVDCLIQYQKNWPLARPQDSLRLVTSSYTTASQISNSDQAIKEMVSNLSKTVAVILKPEFKFKYLEELNTKINHLSNLLKSLSSQPYTPKNIWSIMTNSLHLLCLKIFIVCILYPANNIREIFVKKLFDCLVPILNSLITGGLKSLNDWLTVERGLDIKLQTVINEALYSDTQSAIPNSTNAVLPNISRKEEAIIKTLIEKLVSSFFETRVTSSTVGNFTENNIDSISQNIINTQKEKILPLITSNYKKFISEESLKDCLRTVVDKINSSIEAPFVPRNSAESYQRLSRLKNERFRVLLKSKLEQIKNDFIKEHDQNSSKKDKFIGFCKRSLLSAANFVSAKFNDKEVIKSVAEDYIYPKYLGLKDKLIEPETTNTLILSTLPQIDEFLSQMK